MNKKLLIGIIAGVVAIGAVVGGVFLFKHEHIEEIIPAVAPTCEGTGLTEGKKCSVCDTVTVPQTTTSKINCIAGDWIVDIEATKTEDGKRHKECTMCAKIMSEETIPATGSLGLAYTVNSNGTSCTITGIGTCTDSHVVIPTVIDGYNVTAIAKRAFYECTTMTEITIPASVTIIGTQVFYKAENLSTVYYNSTYSSTENKFLNLSHITKVVFNGTSVPSNILKDATNITEAVIGDNVKRVYDNAFYNCSLLTSLTIGNSVTSIGWYAFEGCSSLTSIEIPDSVTSIGSSAFYGCTSLTSVTIGDSVTSIGYEAFYNCSSLTSIVIPDSVTSIGSYAFRGCSSLTSIEIPDSVTSFGDCAFWGCSSLTSIEIPDSVTSIGESTFRNCSSLTSVVIGDSVTSIGNHAFDGCSSLTSIEIPDSVTSIGSSAFEDCSSLTSIVIPDSVTSIGKSAFYECTSLTIYCEATSKPSGWDYSWNLYNRPVVWGYKGE